MSDTSIKRQIPAAAGTNPGIIHVDVSGKVLSCLSATAKFSVRPDSGELFEMSGGRYYGNPEAAEFGRLTFYNYSGAAVDVDCIAGNKVYKPDGTISSVNANVVTSGKNARTYTKGWVGNIAAGALQFNGVDAGGQLRKSFSVKNKDAAVELIIYAANGVEMHRCDPRESYVVESGDPISIASAGVAIAYTVCEVYYHL